MRRNLPNADLFLGKSIPQLPNHSIAELVDSGYNGHLFRACNALTASTLAFKFVPRSNLIRSEATQDAYILEARHANVVQHQCVVRIVDIIPYEDASAGIDGVFFISDFVEGTNLRTYLKQNKQDIGIVFVETLLGTLFELLYELKERQMSHGDLHTGNILVGSGEYELSNRPVFRVTDFGVGLLTSDIRHANDYLQVAAILRQLLETINYQHCESRDRFIYNVLKYEFLDRHLTETDLTADELACNPRGLMDKLSSLEDRHRQEKSEPAVTLLTPFDYPNCEQMGNSHLLLKNLYSDRLLGLAEIKTRSNLVLTGPRGCGKTTVYRALSLDYLVSTDGDNPNEIDYVGVYYRCDDLYFSFPRYTVPERVEAFDVPMHFLVVTLLARALESVAMWAGRFFADEFEKKEDKLVSELWDVLGWKAPTQPDGNKVRTLVQRLSGRERRRAAEKQRFAHVNTEPIEGYLGPQKLFEVCFIIRRTYSFLSDRQFYFFIDDYSHPKITKALQANLNRMLMHRSPDVFFKISTESPVSFVREDIDGKQFVESREYDMLNLGIRYISQDAAHTQEFLEDLFDRRFREVETYPVKHLRDLLGSFPRNENETARSFREKRGKESYAGVETVSAMCSGDIHYMIRLVSAMVEDFGGSDSLRNVRSTPRIPPRKQHASIRRAAGSFVESVRTLPRWGPRLANVISSFGNVARSYLRYEDSTNEQGSPPHQASRIEPYAPLSLSPDAQEILDELLRYSILIEDPRGKSRRGDMVPRFYIRRYLVPHFQLTFSKRDSLQLENKDLDLLLREPQQFEKTMRLRSSEDAQRKRTHPRHTQSQQRMLFNE